MTAADTPNRERQALLEVGRTAIYPAVAWGLVALFLATVCAVPLVDGPAGGGPEGDAGPGSARLPGPLSALVERLPGVASVFREGGFFAGNRRLLSAISDFEDRLEEESRLREGVLPPVQAILTVRLGLGNEKAYLGKGGWLFYRPDIDYVTGPGFLDPRVLRRRSLGGDLLAPAPQPDPMAALVEFHRQLRRRGIRLLVVPTPAKPTLHPERFASRVPQHLLLQNPSFEEFQRRLTVAGLDWFDPTGILATAKSESGEPQFLRSDTHWTPGAVERVARGLADYIEERVELAAPENTGYLRRQAVVENVGDIAVMLRLPPGQRLFPPERVRIAPVLTLDGRLWRPDPEAEILLLGDSYANIFSDASLGWGAGAGLAEQLSYFLQRPLDKIALNAGGAYATRQALAREIASGIDRLEGKRLVIYQFAVRELAGGDWKLLHLRGGISAPGVGTSSASRRQPVGGSG